MLGRVVELLASRSPELGPWEWGRLKGMSVAFSPDGLTVLTAGRDGQTLLWPAASWQSEPSPTAVTRTHGLQLP